MKPFPAFAALIAALAASATAAAHPLPRAASPAPNAILAASPPEIRVTFSEPLVAAFSKLELVDQAGKPVPLGASVVDPNDRKQLAALVKGRLPAGTYIVNWHAVAADTHHVAGHYSFQVK